MRNLRKLAELLHDAGSRGAVVALKRSNHFAVHAVDVNRKRSHVVSERVW